MDADRIITGALGLATGALTGAVAGAVKAGRMVQRLEDLERVVAEMRATLTTLQSLGPQLSAIEGRLAAIERLAPQITEALTAIARIDGYIAGEAAATASRPRA